MLINQKGGTSLIGAIVLIGIIFFGLYLYKKSVINYSEKQIINYSQDVYKPQPIKRSKIYFSGDKKYSLVVSYTDDGFGKVECTKTLLDRNGLSIYLKPETVEFLDHISCHLGMDLTIDGIKNFSGDNIIFEFIDDTIEIFNIKTQEREIFTYTPDHRDLNFFAADTDLRYFLFTSYGYPFIDQVKDFDGNEVFDIQPLLSLDNNHGIQSYYDSVNKGILYLTNMDENGRRVYQFNFFDLKSLKMKKLKLFEENTELGGRDCLGNRMISEKGAELFYGYCMNLYKKDSNKDNEIVLEL